MFHLKLRSRDVVFRVKSIVNPTKRQIFRVKMDKGFEKEHFTTISFKNSVAKKFRSFSRKLSKSNSMSLSLMVDFFEYNQISPIESLGPNMKTLEGSIKKRINSLIAILRDIEKKQTKPTTAMLELLFENIPADNKSAPGKTLAPKRPRRTNEYFKTTKAAIEIQKHNDILKQELERHQQHLKNILDNSSIQKTKFGRTQIVLNIPREEFQRLQSKL